ncbi:MAG: TonB-dependent receptor [Maribacter dokdonensis]|uniref:SusC/RagA family TonB-linked outer membrane protein n=3 Tax=Maribacter dokdonensis TaxID=320912 RepID=UPI003264B554
MGLTKAMKLFDSWVPLILMVIGLLMSSNQYVLAQDGTVSGTVIDGSGMPLAGASVLEKGTTNGTQTDFDGNYSIGNVSDGILVFSYIGFKSKEVAISGQSIIDVVLEEDASQLDEVVVIGYGTQKKSDLTGAVSQVASKDIDKYTYSDASQALQGRMAGVSVQTQGGSPGASAVIAIRGTGTMSDAGPLYVIDGMLTGGMESLNPSDIESISVLKDASASAIYGSRAANGVVIITTKKGKRGGLSVDFDTSYGFQSVINTLDWADASQYAEISNRSDDNDGSARKPANDTEFDPSYSSDLYKESLRSAAVQNTNIRLAGGGENTLFSFSMNYFDQDGIVKYSDFKRYTARANGSFTKNKFKLETTLGLTRTVNNPNPYFNKERNILPTIRLKDSNGDWSSSDLEERGIDASPGSFYGQSSIYNELGMAALEDRTVTRNTFLGNLSPSYEIIDGLTYKLNLGLEYYNNNNYTFTPNHPVFLATGVSSGMAELNETNVTYQSWLLENTLNYQKVFGNHSINLLGGYTEQETNSRSLGVIARGFPSNDIRVASAALEIQNVPSEDITSTIQSYFARLNYVFDDRYLLTATVRRDGSSLFTDDLRWGTFPSMALGWNVSNEKFMEDNSLISDLKLRVSYGEIGSNNVSAYAIDPSLNLFSEYILGEAQTRVTGYSITQGVNQNITWETTKTTDIGAELGILDNRLRFTMDYFIKKSEDVLVGLRLPLYTGFGNEVPFNTASVENKGFEFLADYKEQLSDDFVLGVSANFSLLDNEVTALGDASPIIQGSFTSNTINSTRTDVGQPISSFYGYIVDGIYQTDAEATAANDQVGNPSAGDFKFKDLDGDGDIDDDDRTYIGNPTPDLEYGFNLTAEYKKFDLNLFFNGVAGNEILNGTKYRGYFDLEGNYFADALNAWSPTNTSTNIPKNTRADLGFNRRMSTFYLEPGDYFRLRNAQLGYSFSDALLEKMKIKKMRLYVSATNLFTITNYTGYYPEVGRNSRGATGNNSIFNSGVDEGTYPTPREFRLGLQVSF